MFRVVTVLVILVASTSAFGWVCGDDASTRALSNNQTAGNYRIKRTGGGDSSVLVTVYDGDVPPNEIFEEVLPIDDEGLLVGVPVGGAVVVSDPADGDTFGANGTIALE